MALQCAIAAENQHLKTLLSDMDAEKMNSRLSKWGKSYLERIVARTAIWVTKYDFNAYPDGVRYPKTRRRKKGDARGNCTSEQDPKTKDIIKVTLDSNNKPNYMMKFMLRHRYGLEAEEY